LVEGGREVDDDGVGARHELIEGVRTRRTTKAIGGGLELGDVDQGPLQRGTVLREPAAVSVEQADANALQQQRAVCRVCVLDDDAATQHRLRLLLSRRLRVDRVRRFDDLAAAEGSERHNSDGTTE